MKLIVYTALIADESLPLEDVGQFYPFEHNKDDVKYIAYTNRKDLKSEFWDVVYVEVDKELSPRMMSRKIKWNPTIYLEDFTHSIWMDSQCYFVYDPKEIVNYYLGDKYHTAIHHHTDLQSVYVEGMVSSYLYKTDRPEKINRQLEKYYYLGMPYKYDHFETGILIRKNCDETTQFSEKVFDELLNHSIRDQISTPFVVWHKRKNGDSGIFTIKESFTAHKGQLPLPKSSIFFTMPKPSEKLREDLSKR